MSLTLSLKNPRIDFMEFKSQTPPDASLFLSAPGSPDLFSPNSMQFYSAPTSPIGNGTPDKYDHDKDFKFETNWTFDCPTNEEEDDDNKQQRQRRWQQQQEEEEQQKPRRGASLPAMAFADELFYNGRVLPLKLPPRLQQSGGDGQRSVPLSPRSPVTVLRIPFGRRATWNDDFDPFVAALQKVSSSEEEKKKRGRCVGENNNHRRTRSHSPFRNITFFSSNDSESWYEYNNNNVSRDGPFDDPLTNSTPKTDEQIDISFSEKVVQKETNAIEAKTQVGTKRKRLKFGGKGRTVIREQEGPLRSVIEGIEKKGVIREVKTTTTKVQRLKGILMRFASFGREKSDEKGGYFKRLSFKSKGSNGHQCGGGGGDTESKGKGEEGKPGDHSKMALIQYRAKLPLCLGYGLGSP